MKKIFFVLIFGFTFHFANGQSIYFLNTSFKEAVKEAKQTGRKIFVYVTNGSDNIENTIFPKVSERYNKEYICLRRRSGGDFPYNKAIKAPAVLYYSIHGTLLKGPIPLRSLYDLE